MNICCHFALRDDLAQAVYRHANRKDVQTRNLLEKSILSHATVVFPEMLHFIGVLRILDALRNLRFIHICQVIQG